MRREDQGIPKYIFAQMVGISRPYLNTIERGTADVPLSLVERMAHALAVDPLHLLSENRRLR